MRRRAFLLTLVAAGGLTACGARDPRPPGAVATTPSPLTRSSGRTEYFALPRESLTDWVSYGDCVLTCRVVAEHRLEPRADEAEAGEGVVPREVTLALDATPAWSHGAWRTRARIPESLVDGNGAWEFHGEKETRLVIGQEAWMAVGERYALVVSFTNLHLLTPAEPDETSLVTLAALRLANGTIEVDDRTAEPYRQVDGRTLPEFAALLDDTPPYPQVLAVLDEDPLVRAAAVES